MAPGEAAYLTDDDTDPSRALIRQVLDAVSEYERGDHTTHEVWPKVTSARGGYAGYGSPAYGQRAAGSEVVPDDNEQAAIARMRELRGQGRSWRPIAGQLNADGVPASGPADGTPRWPAACCRAATPASAKPANPWQPLRPPQHPQPRGPPSALPSRNANTSDTGRAWHSSQMSALGRADCLLKATPRCLDGTSP